jgi:hypothetical protein
MADDVVTGVAFSIPVGNEPPGRAKQKLATLLGKIERANIRLKAISWFSYGRRGRLFCVPKDLDVLELIDVLEGPHERDL